MVQGTNKAGEVSAYTFNGLGVRVGTEQILQDNSHGYTDFHCQTPSVETGIEKPEVVKTDYVIDYTRLDIDQRVLMKSEQDGYDFFYTYGLDKLQVMTIGEGSNWWGQSIKKCVNMAYVHTDRLGSVVNLSDQYGRVTARADYTDWGEVRKYTDITVDQGFRRLLPEITYATHEYDDVLNQFYAKARMYDAENKRFTAVDPILDPAGYDISSYVSDPMMLVQYLYVKDDAVNWIDTDGLRTVSIGGYAMESITRGGRAYVPVRQIARAYGGKTLVKEVSGGGRSVSYKTTISNAGKDYTFRLTTVNNGNHTPQLAVYGNRKSLNVNGHLWNYNNTNYVDAAYFRDLMCSTIGINKAYKAYDQKAPTAAIYHGESGYASVSIGYANVSQGATALTEGSLNSNGGQAGKNWGYSGSAEIGGISSNYGNDSISVGVDLFEADIAAGVSSSKIGLGASANLAEGSVVGRIPVGSHYIVITVEGKLGVGGDAGWTKGKGIGASLAAGLGGGIYVDWQKQ